MLHSLGQPQLNPNVGGVLSAASPSTAKVQWFPVVVALLCRLVLPRAQTPLASCSDSRIPPSPGFWQQGLRSAILPGVSTSNLFLLLSEFIVRLFFPDYWCLTATIPAIVVVLDRSPVVILSRGIWLWCSIVAFWCLIACAIALSELGSVRLHSGVRLHYLNQEVVLFSDDDYNISPTPGSRRRHLHLAVLPRVRPFSHPSLVTLVFLIIYCGRFPKCVTFDVP
ncbi:hypothetical protein Cgig2_025403 [Carnegiea gigantea]|uniref:Uncharacterized protein n=1 Tax=Carnegiea gigantea TaxID=171969 RepID=A0A9Q1K0X5_9CARY|nr:hypothetical protein Cgig2_025403 [Carnegiea gigantea]